MGMFDYYIPKLKQHCPVCKKELIEWQGKDGDCKLFIWKQGKISPIDQDTDDEDYKLSRSELKKKRLPPEFIIYSDDCGCPYFIEAICTTTNQIWDEMIIIDKYIAKQRKNERKGEFKQRLKWLSKG